MSRDLNQCNFIGRLGNDPESRDLPSGESVCNISLAVGDDYKDKQGQKVEQTEWVRVSAFGKLAEIMQQYLKKGSKVYISGKMKTRKWEKDGQTMYSTDIKASEMIMLDPKGDSSSVAPSSTAVTESRAPEASAGGGSFEDDIPFAQCEKDSVA